MLLINAGEPKTFENAMSCNQKNKRHKAMQEQLKSLHENRTFESVKLPKNKKILKNK